MPREAVDEDADDYAESYDYADQSLDEWSSYDTEEQRPADIVRIDSYFSRNYEPGKRILVPEECYEDPNKWRSTRLRRLGFYDDIYHEKNDMIVDQAKYRPRINLRERERENNPHEELHPEHLEFKVWLQHRVEMAATGRGSPRMLVGIKDARNERKIATEKLEELTERFRGAFEERLLSTDRLRRMSGKYDGCKTYITALLLMDKAKRIRKRGFDEAREYSDAMMTLAREEHQRWDRLHSKPEDRVGDPIQMLCSEVVQSLFVNHRSKTPSVEGVFKEHRDGTVRKMKQLRAFAKERGVDLPDGASREEITSSLIKADEAPRDEWGWVVISEPSAKFLTTLRNKVTEHMVNDWIPTVLGLTTVEEGILKLTKWEKDELTWLRDRGWFGRRRTGSEKTKEERAEKTRYGVGKLCYAILSEMVRTGIIEQRPMNHGDVIDHGSEKQKDQKQKGSYSSLIEFAPRLLEWTTQSDYGHFRRGDKHPIYRWLGGESDRFMYAPPKDHIWVPPPPSKTENPTKAGGFLLGDNRKLIGGGHSDYERFNPPTPRCLVSELTVSSLNVLQRTQWEINLDFLLKAFHVLLPSGQCKGGIPGINMRIVRINARSWVEEALDGNDEVKNDERARALMWSRKIINHNANVFWQAWMCEFRGRLFTRGSQLSPQGDDLDRALIRFKHWKPLGEEGKFWLHVHVHNLLAGRKRSWKKWSKDPPEKGQSFKERDRWVNRNLSLLRLLADKPYKHTGVLGFRSYSGAKSQTFQRLAALLELKRVHEEWKATHEDPERRDWSKVTSGLPVCLDASCNGYQHLSALLRDRNLAEHVNVVAADGHRPGRVTGDLYQAIADEAGRNIRKPGNELATRIQALCMLDQDATDKSIAKLCSRSIAKAPTMTRMYGSTYTLDCFIGRQGKGKPGYYASIRNEDGTYRCPNSECDVNNQYKSRVVWHAKDKKHMQPCWHEESPMARALLNPVIHTAYEDPSCQAPLGVRLNREYAIADSTVTKDAYKKYKNSLQAIAKLGVKQCNLRNVPTAIEKNGKYMFKGKPCPGKTIGLPLWENAARWRLPDGYEVRNYYIKHVEPSATRRGQPARSSGIFSHLTPEWYDPGKQRPTIFARLEELDVDELENYRTKTKYKPGLDEHVREKIKEEADQDKKEKLEEVSDILSHVDIHLPRYEENEKDRVWLGKPVSSISPHLIHSLDAYHMRQTIAELSNSIEDFDFWPVHDAFGTHAGDIQEMLEVIRRAFCDLHDDRDINYWLGEMTRPEMRKSAYMHKDRSLPQLKAHTHENVDLVQSPVVSTYYHDKRYRDLEENGELHELIYGRCKKDELKDYIEENEIELASDKPTTKADYIRKLIDKGVAPRQGWLPVPKPRKADYVRKLVEEEIDPPQEWVSWVNNENFDTELIRDARESGYLVD